MNFFKHKCFSFYFLSIVTKRIKKQHDINVMLKNSSQLPFKFPSDFPMSLPYLDPLAKHLLS